MGDGPGTGRGTDDLDELEHGAERRPWPPGAWVARRWAALPRTVRATASVLVAVAVVALGWHGVRGAPVRSTGATGSVRPSPTPPLSLSLAAEGACNALSDPVLQVGFRLTNIGSQPVTIRAVASELPIPMLLTLGVDLTSPPCRSRSTRQGGAAVPGDGVLQPGASLPVTFRLIPLVDCAAPAPVQAAVTLAGDGQPVVVTVPVYPDLGSVRFPGCAAQTS